MILGTQNVLFVIGERILKEVGEIIYSMRLEFFLFFQITYLFTIESIFNAAFKWLREPANAIRKKYNNTI